MERLEVILNTGRSIRQGEAMEGKTHHGYQEAVAVCEMDPADMDKIRIKEGDNVKIKTKYGAVIVKATESHQAPHEGIVFMPMGPWASVVIDPNTDSTGMPSLKNIKAVITPASDEKVLDIFSLTKQTYLAPRSLCEIDPSDMVKLGISARETVYVQLEGKEITTEAVSSLQAPHPGIVYVHTPQTKGVKVAIDRVLAKKE